MLGVEDLDWEDFGWGSNREHEVVGEVTVEGLREWEETAECGEQTGREGDEQSGDVGEAAGCELGIEWGVRE